MNLPSLIRVLRPIRGKEPRSGSETGRPGLAAKRRKRRKKDGAAELCLHCSTVGGREFNRRWDR